MRFHWKERAVCSLLAWCCEAGNYFLRNYNFKQPWLAECLFMREFNKRGQESKFLTGFPTLLIILVFIGIFIGFSFTLAGGKNIRGMSGIEPEDAGTFLYQPIIADGTETLIIDEVARVAVQGRSSQGLERGLAELRTRSNTYECILLAFAPENPASQG